jgi:intein/homing endonuclease
MSLSSYEVEQEILKYYKNTLSLTKTSQITGHCQKTCSRIVKKYGIEVINYQNRSRLNENIFEYIDTEEKAYWLGFIYADGYIGLKTNDFELSLQEKDFKHLTNFKNFIKLETNLAYRIKTKSYRLSFRNKIFKKNMINLGVVPNKSLILEFPKEKQVPNKFLYSFIRGYFDGDGSIHKIKNANNYSVQILGTYDLLTKMYKFLGFKNRTLYNKNGTSSNCYFLQWSGKNAMFILDKLYLNSTENTRLERKYEKYLNFKNIAVSKRNL